MSFSIDYHKECSICKKNVIDTDGIKSSLQRCVSCKEVFFICTHCLGNKCPKCDGMLANKNETFPDNLFLAIRKNDFDRIQYLCNDERMDINEVFDENGETPLISAAVQQSYEICEYLINECHASVHKKNKSGRTALIEMVRRRNTRWSAKFVYLFRSSVNEQDNDGSTALMFSAVGAGLFGSKSGNIKIIQQLLELGANLTQEDRNGYTALGWAKKSNDKSKTSNNQNIAEYLEHETIKYIAMNEL